MGNKQTANTKALRSKASNGSSQLFPKETFFDIDYNVGLEQLPPNVTKDVSYVHSEELARWYNMIGWKDEKKCGQMEFVKWCSSDWDHGVKHGHDVGHPVGVTYNRCNARCNCPECAGKTATKHAHEMYDMMEDEVGKRLSFDMKLFQFVFTLPKDMANMDHNEFSAKIDEVLREILGPSITRAEYKKRGLLVDLAYRAHKITLSGFNEAMKALQVLYERGVSVGAYAKAIQTYSSDNPFEDHLHCHVILLNVGYNKARLFPLRPDKKPLKLDRHNPKSALLSAVCQSIPSRSSSSFDDAGLSGLSVKEPTDPYAPSSHFFRLDNWFGERKVKRLWNQVLGRDPEAPVDVNLSYLSFHEHKAKAIHWLKYIYRYPVWDMFKMAIRRNMMIPDKSALPDHDRKSDKDTPANRPYIMSNYDTSMILPRLEYLNRVKRKVSWCGWMSPTKRQKMTSELGYYMSLTERRKVAKTKAKYCQYVDPKGVLCGAPLVKILPDDFYEYIAGKRKLADVRLDDRMVSGSKQHYYMSHE